MTTSAPPSPPVGGVSRRPTSLDVGAARATCSICDDPHYAHGWCRPHYARWRKHDDPKATIPVAYGGPPTPLTCDCVLPNVGYNDGCVRCHRVIAEHVHQRRQRAAT